MPLKLNVVMLMVSEKCRISTPVFISSSKLSKMAIPVSLMTRYACRGSSMLISITGIGSLSDVSTVGSVMRWLYTDVRIVQICPQIFHLFDDIEIIV